MATKNIAAFAIYPNRGSAGEAVDLLIEQGFRLEDVSVLMQENAGTKDFAHEKHTKAPEGTTAGVVAGGAIGGTLGLLFGIGVLAIPGIGPFLAAGPIMTTLAGLGSGGLVGGMIGALVGMGIPEFEAKRYEGRIRNGGVLVSVHCDNREWVDKAMQTLRRSGGEDASFTGESSGHFATADKPVARTAKVG